MGGTFDPIHNGHLYIAERAREEFGLSEIWFMPAGDPYFKSGKKVTPARQRYEMSCLAVMGKEGFFCSDLETEREGKTYTSDTLSILTEQYPEDSFFFIIGADSLFQLETWHCPELIFRYAVILCAGRDREPRVDAEIERLRHKYRSSGCDIRRIHADEINISSTMIRDSLAKGEDVSGLLPEKVLEYISRNRLYQTI